MRNRVGTSHVKNAAPAWELPAGTPDASLGNRSSEDIAEWSRLVERVFSTATLQGWSKAEVSRRLGMSDSTFSLWYSGKYTGRLDNQNNAIAQWLAALEETADLAAGIPQSPKFIRTRTATEVVDTLSWAQMSSDLVIITLAAGLGKTAACNHYRSTRAHVFRVTVSPYTRTVHGLLNDIAAELELVVHNPARLTRAIGDRLRRTGGGTLLIIDEAQNLVDEAINQLRHFVDVYECGVALVGNDEIYGRFWQGKSDAPSFAQIKRRIGKRLQRMKPYREDIDAFIDAWGVSDPDCIKFLTGIGMKAGALGQIDKTMKLATLQSIGSNQPLSLEHIQSAWKNRDVEDMA
nr:MAG TPA: Mu B transposition protein, C terminal [Caudoviricetes sp.]